MAHHAGGDIGQAVLAVVVAHQLQTQHAGQGGHVHLALVFIAIDEVDRVARALVGVAAVALGCRSRAITRGTARRWGARLASAATTDNRWRDRGTALGVGVASGCADQAARQQQGE